MIDSTRLQFRVGADLAEPGNIRELKWCIASKGTDCYLLSRCDDLTERTWAELMNLIHSSAIDASFERVLLELAIPGVFGKIVDGAPLVGGIQEGNPSR